MSGYMNERQAARYLDVSPTFLRCLRERGLIRAEQVTGRRRALYSEAELDTVLLRLYRHRSYRVGRETVVVVYDE